jgi:hypothetical protein
MNEEALRTTYASIRTYKEERNAWEAAYYDLKEKSEAFASSQRGILTRLEAQLEVERAEWRRAVRRARSPGFGVFGGIGYTPGGYEPVIGVGVVWRLF